MATNENREKCTTSRTRIHLERWAPSSRAPFFDTVHENPTEFTRVSAGISVRFIGSGRLFMGYLPLVLGGPHFWLDGDDGRSEG